MLPLLLILFILVPLVELYVIIQVGQAIGALPTIAILVADSILGSMLMRHQGRASWRRFNLALREGRVPTNEVLDGVLVIFGGALLLTPGFITDIFGLLFLLPPTRALVRRIALRRVAVRMAASATSWGVGRVAGRGGRTGPAPGYDVEGSASETKKDQDRLP